MKCKVFLDTNAIYTDKRTPLDLLFNERISELRTFLKDHSVTNVDICLPEIVVKERIQHKMENINEAIQEANKCVGLLQGMGHKEKVIKPRKDYKKKLEASANAFVKKHNLKVVPVPKIEQDSIIERAITKKKPFNDKTAGFKDTLIYLSIVDDALKGGADEYIFCTENYKDFDESVRIEFEKETGKKLHILPDIIGVQQKLDEILPLRLHLEERDKKIKNLIQNNTGVLVYEANKTLSSLRGVHRLFTPTAINWQTYGVPQDDQDEKAIGYVFKDLDFLGIQEAGGNTFRVDVRLKTEVKYKEEDVTPSRLSALSGDIVTRHQTAGMMDLYMTDHVSSTSFGRRNRYLFNQKDFQATVICNLKNNTVVVKDITDNVFTLFS